MSARTVAFRRHHASALHDSRLLERASQLLSLRGRNVAHEIGDQDCGHWTFGRIHAHKGRPELIGEAHLIVCLEKPGEHRLEVSANALSAEIGTNPLEMTPDPDRDQDEDHSRRDDQDPQRQPERSHDH